MKQFVFMLFLLMLSGVSAIQPTAAAVDEVPQPCGMSSSPQSPIVPATHYGGRFITSTGTLRVLVVFVRFSDDNEGTATWPNPSILPEWAARFVDTVYSASGNYYYQGASKYFWENSYGKLHVIGDVFYVITDSVESYYHRVSYQSGDVAARGTIETEVLNKLDAPPYSVDFQRYDNWTFGSLVHSPVADDVLDMCWFLTRNLHDTGLPQGHAPFGIGRAIIDCPDVVKDGVLIKGWHGNELNSFPGSGIGEFEARPSHDPVTSYDATGPNYPIVNIMAHEMSHYFFGRGHFADDPDAHTAIGTGRKISLMKPYAGG